MSSDKTMAVILAAGEGKRMGLPKALLEYEKNKSFVGHLASVFAKAGCSPLIVTGKHTEEIRAQHPELALVPNSAWEEGQFSSVKAGMRAALEEGAEVVVLHPVDMPTVRASTVTALMAKLDGAEAAVPEFEGAIGHPLLLTRGAVEKVLAMDGVPHMEAALQRLTLKKIPTKDPGVMVNLNTPDIYERILGTPPHLAPAKKKRGRTAAAETA
jgi:molybdenum cofactor cytidylyltransferase